MKKNPKLKLLVEGYVNIRTEPLTTKNWIAMPIEEKKEWSQKLTTLKLQEIHDRIQDALFIAENTKDETKTENLKEYIKVLATVLESKHNLSNIMKSSRLNESKEIMRPVTSVNKPKKKLNESLEDDTSIQSSVVASEVVNELVRYLAKKNPKLSNEIGSGKGYVLFLVKRQADLYKADATWRERMNASGDKGRDTLYMFMRHWLAAEIKRKQPEVYKVLPSDFANGVELTIDESVAARRPH